MPTTYLYTPELVRSSRLMSGPGGPEPIGPSDVLKAGWVPHEDRTSDQKKLADAAVAGMRQFAFAPHLSDPQPGDKVLFWDVARAVLGHDIPCYYQELGSCVGQGGGKCIRYCSLLDTYVRGDAERYVPEFLLFTYGRSRLRAGLTRPGDGSFGSAFAEAASKDGWLRYDLEGLPRPRDESPDADWAYGSRLEREWSDGDARPITDWLDKAKANLVETAPVRSADEVREAIRSYQPVSIASDWGGAMSPRTEGTPAVLLNSRRTTWMHQMCVLAWWYHPTLGEIFWIQNSWSKTAHGRCPTGAPAGGFWVKKGEIDYITRQGDSFRFNSLTGYDPGHIDWDWLKRRPA